MKDGQEILGFDRASKQEIWTRVLTWLHKTTENGKYRKIHYEDNERIKRFFLVSDYHNIAVSNDEDFKYTFPIEFEGHTLHGYKKSV